VLVAEYEIRWSRDARKELDRIPQKFAERIYSSIGCLRPDPRAGAVLKLKGGSGTWRLRVGDYRVLYGIDDSAKMITILVIQHRKDVYRGL
jgi:mRNA interferase RelE/StbE